MQGLEHLSEADREWLLAMGLQLLQLRQSGERLVLCYLLADEPAVAVVARRRTVDTKRPPAVHSRRGRT